MSDDFGKDRLRMVDSQIRARGVRDERVLGAMGRVPRHLFVPESLRALAYADEPLPIGEGQTISQPYIVAFMTEALELRGDERILEVGTGSGYQTAVLAELADEVWTVEIVESLALRSRRTLEEMGYRNIRFKVGDGSQGWPEGAPFDAIIVTAAAAQVPEALKDQLGPRGRMVVPVGTDMQELHLVSRENGRMKTKHLLSVRFVPLVTGPR